MKFRLVLCSLLVIALAGCGSSARSRATPTWTSAPTARSMLSGGGNIETPTLASPSPPPLIASATPLPTLALAPHFTPTPPPAATLAPFPTATTMAIPSFTPPPAPNLLSP